MLKDKSMIAKILGIGLIFTVFLTLRFNQVSLAADANEIYLPVISRNSPPPPTVFGVEVHSFTDPDIIQLAVDARVSWVRIAAFNWDKIEPDAPVNGVHNYNWNLVPESSLLNISNNDMYPIATVKKTPYWAQKYEGIYCGPVAQKNLADFALFMQAAVERYSKPPYNILHWELGNEPDVGRDLVPPDYLFGCWGEANDPYYYGGGYYAEMLKVVYPAMKSANPNVKVLIGGLLLDCDPEDENCTNPATARFLEGIIENGGSNYFDIVSYHAYPRYNNPSDPFLHDIHHYKWDERGGIFEGKLNYLNELMNLKGVSKPFMLSEGGLMCIEGSSYCEPVAGADFLDAQASYILWYYVRAMAAGLENAIWYTFEGTEWREVGMIGDDPANPRPAYQVFKFATEQLSEAKYTGLVNTGSPLHGYSFSRYGKTIWILWSPDGKEYEFTLPNSYSQLLDKFGDPELVPENGIIKINSPIYIEF